MMQILLKGDVYHCAWCHKDFRYRGEPTGCGQHCCHGADEPLTPNEVWKRHMDQKKKFMDMQK